jgi:hypothetical protein
MGFHFVQLPFANGASMDFVPGTPFFQGLHPFHFKGGGCHEKLAALSEGQIMGVAKIHGGFRPLFTKVCLEAAGFIVDSGMDYPGVMTGLVGCKPGFFFQKNHPGTGILGFHGQGCGNTDNATANQGYIKLIQIISP